MTNRLKHFGKFDLIFFCVLLTFFLCMFEYCFSLHTTWLISEHLKETLSRRNRFMTNSAAYFDGQSLTNVLGEIKKCICTKIKFVEY